MKTKAIKKVSMLLALAFAFSLFPIVALAADGDLTGVSINGVSVNAGSGGADFAAATANAVTVKLDEEDAEKDDATITGTAAGIGHTVSWYLFDSSASVTSEANIFTGTPYSQGALANGDVLWAVTSDGDTNPVKYYKIMISISQGTTGTISGDSTVDNPILSVILPQRLDFALDPLQLSLADDDTSDTQLKSANFVVVNKTNAPVHVKFDITATGGTDVTFTDDTSDLDRDNVNESSKKVYFAALGAKALKSGSTIDASTPITSAIKFDYDVISAALIPFEANTGTAEGAIEFALGAAVYNNGAVDTLATGEKGYAAFQFYGQLNTYAAWAGSDVKVSGAYTLTALRVNTYRNLYFIDDGLNQVGEAPVAEVIDALGTITGAITAAPADQDIFTANANLSTSADTYSITSAVWSGCADAGTGDKWADGDTPVLTITLTAESGYTFTGAADIDTTAIEGAFLDGAAATAAIVGTPGQTLTFKLTFSEIGLP